MQEVFKIVEQYGCFYKTLFHGLNGSKILMFDIWLEAKKRMVKDGSGGKTYLSGFHVFKSKEDAKHYLKLMMPRNRIIIKCLAKHLRQKPTNKSVWLADEIYIPSQK